MSTKCEVCQERLHKYKCPCCLLKTCSLACVKQHKQENDCNGQRDKTAYTPVRDFSHMNLLSDYRFLEDAGRKADEAARDRTQKNKHRPRFVNKFLQQATKRGVLLKLMPYPLSKRKKNSSFFDYKKHCIIWHTEWLFPQAEAQYTQRVHEEDTLEKAVQHYIHPDEGKPEVRGKLAPYIHTSRDDIKLFMKKADTPAHIQRYYELQGSETVGDCVKGRVIVEYPTIHVVLREHWHTYTLADDESVAKAETLVSEDTDNVQAGECTVVTPRPVYPNGIKSEHTDTVTEETAIETDR